MYQIIESKFRDDEGYFEAFSRDFSPITNDKLLENGVVAERTMNTLLHVLEAYTELYNADGFYAVGDSIREILRIFKFKVYDANNEICRVFFDKSYRSLIELESYGHDIEASWLIDRACQALEDKAYYEEMLPIIECLADGAYKNGIKTEEWIEDISPDNTIKPNQALAHAWKCPYHNGRMCIEMVRRLSAVS